MIEPKKVEKLVTENIAKSVFHFNTPSIQKKCGSIDLLLSTINVLFEAIMLTETWYSDYSDYCLDADYKHFVLNRMNRRNAGVAIHVKASLNVLRVDEYIVTANYYEVLIQKKVFNIFCVVHRPFLRFYTS